ncbi:unnamed protein product [Acanthoscelides obtectus]|uniref:Upstream activation factor subunit spp27 n=1 Tax=Acanthoscelides obtectus TaxID=200917 RepID=A0A9P0JVK0_ACAOB|nr:unnamed protein product [Acanthoscelides obtectus]CAK1623749.1 Upstream activation factor subunit spp27 [Acanthoscelides obtectus]
MADISKEDLRKEIAAILKDADLSSTSAKKVRQELEEKLDANLQSRKKEIDDLVMEFVSSKQDKKKKGKKADSEEDEEEEEEEEEEESEDDKKKKRASTGKKPAAKKAKKTSDDSASEQSEADSEEEYSPKKAKPVKTRKLPPKKKKGSESDSDEDWGKKKGKKGGGKKGGSGYTKTMTLSPELAALVGSDSMARHEVVKKVWAIIKEKNLYDPTNKQYAICDAALMKVIGVKRFRTFGMMKYLKNHFIS